MSHIHEKIDFTVEVFIVYQNKVLLRYHEKYKIWLSVWWHIELDEDPVQAVYREVKEEVGLNIILVKPSHVIDHQIDDYQELIPPVFLNRHRINETHEHVTMVYVATTNNDVIVVWEWEKQTPCKWFTVDELRSAEKELRPSIFHNALHALSITSK